MIQSTSFEELISLLRAGEKSFGDSDPMTDENILFRKGSDRSIESTIAAGLLQVDTPELWTNFKFEPILLPSRVGVGHVQEKFLHVYLHLVFGCIWCLDLSYFCKLAFITSVQVRV